MTTIKFIMLFSPILFLQEKNMKPRSSAREFRTAPLALQHLSILIKLMNPENSALRRKIQGTVNLSHQC